MRLIYHDVAARVDVCRLLVGAAAGVLEGRRLLGSLGRQGEVDVRDLLGLLVQGRVARAGGGRLLLLRGLVEAVVLGGGRGLHPGVIRLEAEANVADGLRLFLEI